MIFRTEKLKIKKLTQYYTQKNNNKFVTVRVVGWWFLLIPLFCHEEIIAERI